MARCWRGFWLGVILTGGVNTAAPIIEKDRQRLRVPYEFSIRWRGLLSIIYSHYINDISVHPWFSAMVKHSCWCSEGIQNQPLGNTGLINVPFLSVLCCIWFFLNVRHRACGFVVKDNLYACCVAWRYIHSYTLLSLEMYSFFWSASKCMS